MNYTEEQKSLISLIKSSDIVNLKLAYAIDKLFVMAYIKLFKPLMPDTDFSNDEKVLGDFQKLYKTDKLYLSYMDLKELPDSICNLTNLEYLDLRNNQLKELPESLKNNKKLRILK